MNLPTPTPPRTVGRPHPENEQTASLRPPRRRRERLSGLALNGAVKLLPLLKLLNAVQRQLAQESVFHRRRVQMQAHLAAAFAELRAEQPRRQALAYSIRMLTELMREEIRDIHRDEVKQAAKEVALATLKHAPALLNVAHNTRLLA